MLIKLNILKMGSCAEILAEAEDHEDGFTTSTYITRKVRIIHNSEGASLVPGHDRLNYHNDNFVLFHSDVPFSIFCQQFIISSYNSSNKYNVISHNCAHAALYALVEIAHIKLHVNRVLRLSKFNDQSFLRFPPVSLTPADLYECAKKHKIQLLQEQSSSCGNLIERMFTARSEFGLWKDAQRNGLALTQNMQIVLDQTDKNTMMRPHHIELYLRVLVDGLKIIKREATPNEMMKYYLFSSQFKEREESRIIRLRDQFLLLVLFHFLCSGAIKSYLALLIEKAELQLDEYTSYFGLLDVMFIGALAFLSHKIYQAVCYEKCAAKVTPLSQALHDILDIIADEELDKKMQYKETITRSR